MSAKTTALLEKINVLQQEIEVLRSAGQHEDVLMLEDRLKTLVSELTNSQLDKKSLICG